MTLVKMKREYGITFIITTHYIEEARRAEKIGFLRKGKILCEGMPNYLLKLHNCKTLEEVFLKLCLHKRKSTITTPDQLNSFKKAYQHDKVSSLQIQKANRRKSIFTTPQPLPAVTFSDDTCSIGEERDSIVTAEINVLQFLISWFKVLYALIRKNLVQDLSDSLQVSFQYISPISQVLISYKR